MTDIFKILYLFLNEKVPYRMVVASSLVELKPKLSFPGVWSLRISGRRGVNRDAGEVNLFLLSVGGASGPH